jgi:predicted ABC-type sugar transport system permease subunit
VSTCPLVPGLSFETVMPEASLASVIAASRTCVVVTARLASILPSLESLVAVTALLASSVVPTPPAAMPIVPVVVILGPQDNPVPTVMLETVPPPAKTTGVHWVPLY